MLLTLEANEAPDGHGDAKLEQEIQRVHVPS
jgi:hypothetical protein